MPKSAAIFSFFSGAGFLDLGFEDAGFQIAYVNEYHKPFLAAYKHSRAVLGKPEPIYGYDEKSIEHVNTALLESHMAECRAANSLVGFIGGPPCPDFAVGGKNAGATGPNGRLSKVYADLITRIRPDFFVFENVKGLYRTHKHRAFFEKLKTEFVEAGYKLHERLINSIQYGAPQDRDRIILIGMLSHIKSDAFDWGHVPYPDRSAFAMNWPKTEVFGITHRLPPKEIALELTVQHWFEKNNVKEHPNTGHCFAPRAGLAKFLSIAEGDDSGKSSKRLHRWRYSPTVAYGNNEVHLHPWEPRRLNVAEALALQSLPKEFELPSSMTLSDMFKTIGNGVPYLAARGIASAIGNYLGVKDETNRAKFG